LFRRGSTELAPPTEIRCDRFAADGTLARQRPHFASPRLAPDGPCAGGAGPTPAGPRQSARTIEKDAVALGPTSSGSGGLISAAESASCKLKPRGIILLRFCQRENLRRIYPPSIVYWAPLPGGWSSAGPRVCLLAGRRCRDRATGSSPGGSSGAATGRPDSTSPWLERRRRSMMLGSLCLYPTASTDFGDGCRAASWLSGGCAALVRDPGRVAYRGRLLLCLRHPVCRPAPAGVLPRPGHARLPRQWPSCSRLAHGFCAWAPALGKASRRNALLISSRLPGRRIDNRPLDPGAQAPGPYRGPSASLDDDPSRRMAGGSLINPPRHPGNDHGRPCGAWRSQHGVSRVHRRPPCDLPAARLTWTPLASLQDPRCPIRARGLELLRNHSRPQAHGSKRACASRG